MALEQPFAAFSPRTRDWFTAAFAAPTAAQTQAWPAIASGEHVLISAPTGSGKTLAAFLWAIDALGAEREESGGPGISLVYVSPLKALSYDIERNLRVPLRGIGADLRVAVRTGDTPQRDRTAMLRKPPDILITTPESLYLMLTGRAQELFAGTRWCIVDEIHAVASTKRGAHLALTLERLSAVASGEVQRIGLSATQNPLEEVARFMVGPGRKCRIVDTGVRKPLDLQIIVPVESMVEPGEPAGAGSRGSSPGGEGEPAGAGSLWSSPGGELPALDPLAGGTEATRRSIWPAIYPELLELINAHRSTILFVNNR
ncbi:MAG: DEAD/DEAH box helicase, partial [Solirubrobacteraceae bacterium]